MLDHSGLTRRQRWMLYPIYVATVLACLSAILFLISLNETREFIGDKGIEYCWMYGKFDRYLFTNLALICLDAIVLSGLYWLARQDCLFIYLLTWAAWYLYEPLLSFFNMSYC